MTHRPTDPDADIAPHDYPADVLKEAKEAALAAARAAWARFDRADQSGARAAESAGAQAYADVLARYTVAARMASAEQDAADRERPAACGLCDAGAHDPRVHVCRPADEAVAARLDKLNSGVVLARGDSTDAEMRERGKAAAAIAATPFTLTPSEPVRVLAVLVPQPDGGERLMLRDHTGADVPAENFATITAELDRLKCAHSDIAEMFGRLAKRVEALRTRIAEGLAGSEDGDITLILSEALAADDEAAR